MAYTYIKTTESTKYILKMAALQGERVQVTAAARWEGVRCLTPSRSAGDRLPQLALYMPTYVKLGVDAWRPSIPPTTRLILS